MLVRRVKGGRRRKTKGQAKRQERRGLGLGIQAPGEGCVGTWRTVANVDGRRHKLRGRVEDYGKRQK